MLPSSPLANRACCLKAMVARPSVPAASRVPETGHHRPVGYHFKAQSDLTVRLRWSAHVPLQGLEVRRGGRVAELVSVGGGKISSQSVAVAAY